ncbi:hypothetical protein niasHT_016954 [Heterodera trifolii]|uniref:BTB domain-containing protein n=1 Tax=Heterodera trifolii TaxID=157864 RepID=A0ABD2LDB0_9BILA
MTASDVFESMFRFDDKNPKTETPSAKKNGSVEIPDISPNAFKVMLSFIYAEDLSELNGDNAMGVLYAANKYNVSSLVKACSEFPINELPNVFFAAARHVIRMRGKVQALNGLHNVRVRESMTKEQLSERRKLIEECGKKRQADNGDWVIYANQVVLRQDIDQIQKNF